jgi:hypothetical protein
MATHLEIDTYEPLVLRSCDPSLSLQAGGPVLLTEEKGFPEKGRCHDR